MKILHVNKFFDLHGGAEAYVHALMERQSADGHDVHAFSTRSPHNIESDDASNFVERFDYKQHEGVFKDLRKGIGFIWNRDAKIGMRRAIADIKPDVIHLHNIYHHLSTSILAPIRKARIPCVQTLHDYKLACPNYKMFTEGSPCERCKGGHYLEAVRHHCLSAGFAENMLAAIEMSMTKLVQSYERTIRIFLCPSQFMADKMAAWGEPPSKLRVLPNPVNLPPEAPSRDGGYLLAAGRLSPEKGLDTLIRAVARVPELELRIAGTGPEEARLRSLVSSLNASNVTFLGFLRKTELIEARQQALAFAVSSVWYENASIAVLEAMADGLPIIASRIGGLPEQVTSGENGFLVDPQNVDAWADTLRQFMELGPSEKARMGAASRQRVVERYGWEKHLTDLQSLYHEAGV